MHSGCPQRCFGAGGAQESEGWQAAASTLADNKSVKRTISASAPAEEAQPPQSPPQQGQAPGCAQPKLAASRQPGRAQ